MRAAAFTLDDYRGILACRGIDPRDVQTVLAGWGRDRDDGVWEGAFVIALREGHPFRYARLHGMRQDGHWLSLFLGMRLFQTEPRRHVRAEETDLVPAPPEGIVIAPVAWQEGPEELNRWQAEGCP